jgi:hypothetical protein
MECSCVDDPANEIAEFDDSAEYDCVNLDERGGDRECGQGLMHRLLHRILCRIESEEKAHDIANWLLQYVGIWL